MPFGERVRKLRELRHWTQRELAQRVDVSMSYISKVENERLHFGDYPSAKFIHRLAKILRADEDELLLLAERVPDSIRERVLARPEAFRLLASLGDADLDKIIRSAKKLSQ